MLARFICFKTVLLGTLRKLARAHTEPIFKSLNFFNVQDIYYLAMLRFYSKRNHNNLPHYFYDFMPHFTIGTTNYNSIN